MSLPTVSRGSPRRIYSVVKEGVAPMNSVMKVIGNMILVLFRRVSVNYLHVLCSGGL